MRHGGTQDWPLNDLMGMIRRPLHKPLMATGTSLGKECDSGSRFQQDLRMARMPRFASRLTPLGDFHPPLVLCGGCICRRRPTGVRRVRVQPSFEGCEVFEEGEHYKTHTHRGLVPIFSWDT
jgi:hypothetical protein